MRDDPGKEPERESTPDLSTELKHEDNPQPTQLPILPMRGVTLFPGISGPLSVGRQASVRLIEDAVAGEKLLGLVAQRNPAEDKPLPTGLYTIGVVALEKTGEEEVVSAPQAPQREMRI